MGCVLYHLSIRLMYIPLLCSLQAYKLPGGAQLARTIYEPYENKYLCMNFVYCVILYAGMRAVQFLYPGRHCDQGIVHVDTRTVGERGRGGGVGRGRRGPAREREREREIFDNAGGRRGRRGGVFFCFFDDGSNIANTRVDVTFFFGYFHKS